MKFIKNLKFGTKISLGFGLLLLLLVVFSILQLTNLNWFSDKFTNYSNISTQQVLAERIQSNLLETRLAFENFVQLGDDTQKETFKEHFNKMEGFINELKDSNDDVQREKDINYILEHTRDYEAEFNKIVEFKEKRDEQYQILLTIGPEMESNLSKIMDDAYSIGDTVVSHSAGLTIKQLLLARLNVAKFLENNDMKLIEESEKYFSEMDQLVKVLENSYNNPQQKESIDSLKKNKDIYINSFREIANVIEDRNKVIKHLDEIGPEISSNAEKIVISIIEEQNTYSPMIKKESQAAIFRMIILSVFGLIFAILVSLGIIRSIVLPVKTVTNTFKEISEGETNVNASLKVNSTDEFGDMAKYFNRFMDKLQLMMSQIKNESWLKTGQTELNEKIRSEQDLIKMSNNIISYTCKYLDAQIGAIYLKNEDGIYRLLGSYAYNRRKGLSNEVKLGEGLIGQAVLEKQMIVVSNIPSDYISISSGVGEAVPKNIVVVPCELNGDVNCVIELGSFNHFSDIQLEFLERVRENIAISVHSLESRLELQKLLDKTIVQSEELQVQQEELRQSNEELEEQTRALIESEELLQTQQEELRVTNEELLERTKNLELQKNDIDNKNKHLTKAQEEIEEKAKALEIASKYKSEFLANMSHELRTPLNSILVLSQLLANKKENEPLTKKQLEFASTIHASGSDLLKIINDILDLSKVEAGKLDINLESVSLQELSINAEKGFRQIAINKGLDFIIEINKDLPQCIVTDAQRVQQILNNILSNAFKFTEKGSVILKITSPEKEDFSGVEVNSKEAIAISISDTGIGIPTNKQTMIFEAFNQSDGTTSRKYGGTGLGLSITKELTHLLGGTIHLKSEEGKGSTFTFVLPVESHSQTGYEVAAATEDILELENTFDLLNKEEKQSRNSVINFEKNEKGKTLLIIEDDINFSNILSELANEKGYNCILAKNGKVGIQYAKQSKPDAIILDINLPDLDGWEIIETLKNMSETRDVPIHVISGNGIERLDDYKNRIIGYLQKPVSLEKINDVFKKIDSVIIKSFKKVLMVDGDEVQSQSAGEVLRKKDISVVHAETGKKALGLLKDEAFDCIILDLKLNDMSWIDFLSRLKDEKKHQIPIIVYTDKSLTQDDEAELQKHAECIIIKGTRSMERLVSEVNLFLHELDSNEKHKKNKAIRSSLEKEETLKGRKILIVDDDMRNVFALSGILEEKGIKVIIGRNGKEGIEKLNQNSDVDLVLMDIMMPEIDGYTAMRQIRKNNKYAKLPIIALTAKAMKEDRQKCIEAGANEYLTKPIEIDKLISLLRVWLYK